MPSFDSTAISRAEYDAGTAVLSLWFTQSGGPYDYYLVPPRIYEGLCKAESKGRYFSEHIREQYTSKKR